MMIRTQCAAAVGLFAMLTLLAACSGHRTAEETAILFLDQYLVAADQQAAIQLTTGRAKTDLQKEIDLLSGVENREQALQEVKPEVHFDKLSSRTRPNGDLALLYQVNIKRPGVEVPGQEVFLLVGKDGDEYKVKSFRFHSPSDTRTSNTP